MGSAVHSAARDVAVADVHDGTATDAADAADDDADAIGNHDGTPEAVHDTKSIRPDLVIGRGKF